METVPLFRLSLQNRPRIASSAQSLHGRAGQAVVERYCLPRLWCIHLYRYYARIWVDGHPLRLKPGHLTIFGPGAQLEYHYEDLSPHVYAHFSLDETESGPVAELPALVDLGAEMPGMERGLQQIAALAALQPLRAEVKLWELLWQLAEHEASPTRRHASLEQALTRIEIGLGEEISVAALAREVGLSHNHLTRLFQAEMGTTVVAYIRRRRAEQARHLLENSTLSLKAIARQIGVGDPRAFNALMKKETGRPPGAWRRN